MTKKYTFAQTIVAEAKELRIDGLTDIQAGTFGVSHNAGETATACYAYAYKEGGRPTDLERPKNKASTATDASYAGWQAVARTKVWAPKDVAFMELPAPARDDKTAQADAARDKRKALSDKVSNALKTYKRGLITQDKLANPDAYKTDTEAKGPKLAIAQLAAHITNAIKTLQGDKVFPDNFAHDDAIAQLVAFQNFHKLDK